MKMFKIRVGEIKHITKTINGLEVDLIVDEIGMWSYRLVGVEGWRGTRSKSVFHTQLQAEGRAKKFIDSYFMSKSND